MPYIDEQSKQELANGRLMQKSGELNYTITKLLIAKGLPNTDFIVLLQRAMTNYLKEKPVSYQLFNDVSGAVVNALFEFAERRGMSHPSETLATMVLRDFYKSIVVPYEVLKRTENGDVYE